MRKVWFWLKNSRLFSLPMSVLSWLVVFVYSYSGGDISNGILALFGIAFAHLATNLVDDYIDLKSLDPANCQQSKCAYIRDGSATVKDLLNVIILYCSIAAIIGVILTLRCGLPVVGLALAGGILTLMYPKLSQVGLSEVAVGIAFGPLLFEGVYFVMHGTFSFELLLLSLSVVMFTIGLMYVHTVLDYEGDVKSHKRTLCSRFGSKRAAINGVWVVYGLGFALTMIASFVMNNPFLLLCTLLFPLVGDLYESLGSYTTGGEKKEFYFRLLKARNLMVYYSLIVIFALIMN